MVNYVQRARDVHHKLQELGMEAGTRKMLELLAEDNEMLRQELEQHVNLLNKMADIVADMSVVGVKLRREWAEVRKRHHPDNEASEDVK
jgi:hypothetical protein